MNKVTQELNNRSVLVRLDSTVVSISISYVNNIYDVKGKERDKFS